MSNKPMGMTFEEFCEKINTDEDGFRTKYIKDPVALVAEHLHIQLEADRAKELRDTVKELTNRVPFPTLYVPGKSRELAESKGPQAH